MTMNVTNEATMVFDSLSSNEAFARSAVAAFVMQLDPTIGEIGDIKTAVSEAVTNCVVHAYHGMTGKVRLNVRFTSDHTVIIKITDKGCGIENVHKAMEPLYTTSPEEDRAGLGFAVMQSFCDSVNVRSVPGRGTTVTLKKKLSPRYTDA